jgi:hypothetical protein
MKRLVASILLAASMSAGAADGVWFNVILKEEGKVIASPEKAGAFGTPLQFELPHGLNVEAIAKAPESDGRSWTQVRFTFFETGDAKFVQEMQMRADLKATPSFDYAVPGTKRKFRVEVRGAEVN